MKKPLLCLLLLLFALGLTAPARATAPPATGPSLGEILNADGTLRAGAIGAFDARQFRMETLPDGRPVFRPMRAKGNGDERWAGGFGLPGNGLNGGIDALAVASNGDVYVGGGFTLAGGVMASRVARWNGTAWSSLGAGAANGVGGHVYAMALAGNGDLYVGGNFTLAGGAAASYVAKWNGTAWSSLGTGAANGMNDPVDALVIAGNGNVYAGGSFTQAGGTVANRVAKWNGTAWSSLGTGAANGVNNGVYAFAVTGNGDLYVGGDFTLAGGTVANRVAKWNGTAWSSLGTGTANGVSGYVAALEAAGNGDVYAGGNFTLAGGVVTNYVARWNGTAWSSLGTGAANGVGYIVQALKMASNGEVYAGGYFTQAGGTAANSVAKWNGTAWSSLGTGTNGSVYILDVGPIGKLYTGGTFTATGDGSKVMVNFAVYDPNAPLPTKAATAAPAAQLFPNPAHGAATLRLPAGAPRLPLTLVDAQGRTVRRFPAPATADVELDLRGLPAGAYVVRYGEYTQRLVVE